MSCDLRLAPHLFRETPADFTQRPRDQFAGEGARRIRGFGQRLAHEGGDDAFAGRPCVPRLGRITIKRRGIIERDTDDSFLALGADEGVNQRAQPRPRRPRPVSEDACEQRAGAPPLIALETEPQPSPRTSSSRCGSIEATLDRRYVTEPQRDSSRGGLVIRADRGGLCAALQAVAGSSPQRGMRRHMSAIVGLVSA